MKKTILLCCMAFLMVSCSTMKPKQVSYQYDLKCAGMASDGSYIVQITSFGKTMKEAREQAIKDAVHGVLFKGIAGNGPGCTPQRPIVSDPTIELSRADYFTTFFADGGSYLRYVSVSPNSVSPTKVSGGYSATLILTINKDLLRKDLEKAGIIRGLSTGF